MKWDTFRGCRTSGVKISRDTNWCKALADDGGGVDGGADEGDEDAAQYAHLTHLSWSKEGRAICAAHRVEAGLPRALHWFHFPSKL